MHHKSISNALIPNPIHSNAMNFVCLYELRWHFQTKSCTKCQKCLTTPYSVYITSNKLVAFSEQKHIQQRAPRKTRIEHGNTRREHTQKKRNTTSKKLKRERDPRKATSTKKNPTLCTIRKVFVKSVWNSVQV